jgi:diguanylate cyclase (GGDEF)-like protein
MAVLCLQARLSDVFPPRCHGPLARRKLVCGGVHAGRRAGLARLPVVFRLEVFQALAGNSTLSVQARTDGLTGLANRRVLEDELVRRLALWREQKTPLVLVLADIDQFKRINDVYGYAGGDAALKHLGSVMTSTLRQTDLVARFGGDEFAMLLAAEGEHATALAISRLVRAIGDAPPLFDGAPLPLTVSFGATSPESGVTSAELFRRADAALKAAKRHGRDCAFWHNGSAAAELAIERVHA